MVTAQGITVFLSVAVFSPSIVGCGCALRARTMAPCARAVGRLLGSCRLVLGGVLIGEATLALVGEPGGQKKSSLDI